MADLRNRRRIDGRIEVTNMDPEVIRLNDSGVKEVVLKFNMDLLEINVLLHDPEALEREISDARAWVRHDG